MREAEGDEDESKAPMREAEGDEDEPSDERPTPEEELSITEAEPADLDFVEETGRGTAARLQSKATPEEREATRQAIQSAKDKLAKKQREVFELRWEEGWPRDEVADYLKIGKGTVKTHEDRIHAKFKVAGVQLPRPLDEGEEWKPSDEEETAEEPLSEEEQTTDEEPAEEQPTDEEATEEKPRRKPKRTRTRYLSKQEVARYFEKPVIRYRVSEWVETGHEPDARPIPHEETAVRVRNTLANKPKAEILKEWLLSEDGQAFIDRARGGRKWPKCEEAIRSILAPPEATLTEPGRRKPQQRYLA